MNLNIVNIDLLSVLVLVKDWKVKLKFVRHVYD